METDAQLSVQNHLPISSVHIPLMLRHLLPAHFQHSRAAVPHSAIFLHFAGSFKSLNKLSEHSHPLSGERRHFFFHGGQSATLEPQKLPSMPMPDRSRLI